MKELWLMEREAAQYGRGAGISLADDQPLTWADIECMSYGRIGTHSLACPFCGPEKANSKRFRLERPSLNMARWRCFYCGIRGSLATGTAANPAEERAARRAAAALKTEQAAERTAKALRLWDEATSLTGTAAIDYLAARAINDLPPQVGDVLRFHGSCPFGKEGSRPCMLALMRDVATNEPRAIHRTWVSSSGKARGRMALGPIARAAVKLWPTTGPRLVVGEGIETVLAAALSLTAKNGRALQPAWALTVANNLAYLPIIADINELVVLADNDLSGVGQRAADQCVQHWSRKGRNVSRLMPDVPGSDFNDVVRARANER